MPFGHVLTSIWEKRNDASITLSHKEQSRPGEDPEKSEVAEPAEIPVLAESIDAMGRVDDNFRVCKLVMDSGMAAI